MAIEEFTLEIPREETDELVRRLELVRWPDQLDGVGWEYGVELGRMRALVEYWRNEFDWRAFEAKVNRLPQYLTEIDGQRIHFFHVRSGNPSATPLLMTHGWPGSGADFLGLVDALSTDFHLVVPSIPGFGFSGATRERGWGIERIAAAWVELMSRLGYERYGVHGYDWGGRISPALVRLVPERVIGLHLNGFLAFPSGDPAELEDLSDTDQKLLAGLDNWDTERSGYASIQGTRPQTLAYALADSPVGLLSWFLEWYDDYGHRVGAIDNDLILATVALTWFTGTAGSAARIYREAASSWEAEVPYSTVPTGLANFPGDGTIRRFAERDHNIVHYTTYSEGGHFAALEVPHLVAEDLRTFFTSLR